MCGTALGMACNGMYAFWGPFFIWIVLGVLNIGGLAADYPPLSAMQWIGALIMIAGIFCIAINPTKSIYAHMSSQTRTTCPPCTTPLSNASTTAKS